MSSLISRSRLFFQDETPHSLGRLTLAGMLKNSSGTGARQMRVLGRYALVFLVEGQGIYRDARGFKSEVEAGDALLISPELAHAYGPQPRGLWSEIYLVFDGPIFDCWRLSGALDPTRPVHHAGEIEKWFTALRQLLEAPRPVNENEHLRQLAQFQEILAQMLELQAAPQENDWLHKARGVLDGDLSRPLDPNKLAQTAGMSYETFRKKWTLETGVSPARYRAQKRIEAAKILLARPEMTGGTIARSLCFRDEFHFSKRFKQLTGSAPREFKKTKAEE